MQESHNMPFLEAKAPGTLSQLYRIVSEQNEEIAALLGRVDKLEKSLATISSNQKPGQLPIIPNVDWEAVKKLLPKMEMTTASCNKYHEQFLRLGFQPTLRQMVEKQQRLQRHEGVHYSQLWAHFSCTKGEALAWIWFLRKAGLAKDWINKGTYCKTDLEYKFSSSGPV